ncbi:MAG: phosphotransferase [Ignavibacteriaceae bacterium]|nr:phosphotransferase [Ignavibacteriaceae bacterium]
MSPQVIRSTIVASDVFFKKQLNINDFKKRAIDLIDFRRSQKRFPIYNSFFNQQIKNEKNREILYNIYIQASRYLESFFGQSKYHAVFNAHGLIHIQRVIDNLAKLLRNCLNKDGDLYFSEEEYMSVYLAALLHDLGMIPDEYIEEMEFKQFKDLRKEHCFRIFKIFFMNEIWGKIRLDNKVVSNLNDLFLKRIAFITLYHDSEFPFIAFLGRKIIKTIKTDLEITIDKSLIKKLKSDNNLRILSGLLALADKMDYGKTRTPVPPIRSSNLRSLYDEFEYIKNECIISCEVKKEEKQSKIIISYKYGDKSEVANPSFAGFLQNGFDKQGKLLPLGIQYAVSDLIENVLKKSWENIKEAFNINNCNIQFLNNLEPEYNRVGKLKYKIRLLDNNIKIRGTANLDWQEKALINHIFKPEKFKSLILEQITQGFSGELGFYVNDIKIKDYPGQEGFYPAQNKFLKIGNYDKIHTEVQNYKKIALPYLPPKSTIGHIEEFKFLDKGGYLGSIIQDGNSRVTNLSKFLTDKPIDLLCNYNKESFKLFYGRIKPIEDRKGVISFYQHLRDERKKSFDKIEDFNRKELATKALDKFTGLIRRISNTNELELHASLIHGDFTFRNILKSSDDLVFIDFAESNWGHFFFDFVKMDHYLRFECIPKFDINYVKKEEELMSNNRANSEQSFDLVYSNIWKIFSDYLKINEKNFIVQKYLAYVYMNLWCLPFEDGTIHLDFDERLSLFDLYLKKINKLLDE